MTDTKKFLQEKMDNFVAFTETHFKDNEKIVAEIRKLCEYSPEKMLQYTATFLLPFKDNIDSLADMIYVMYGVKRDDVPKEIQEKFILYFEMFIETYEKTQKNNE